MRAQTLKLVYGVDRDPVAAEAAAAGVSLLDHSPAPLHYPIDWLSDEAADDAPPKLRAYPGGRVAGIVAPAGRCLLDGSGTCWKIPRPVDGRGSMLCAPNTDHGDYYMAHVGSSVVIQPDGSPVEVATAVIAGPGGHANPFAGPGQARSHYDNTIFQVARGRYVWSDKAGGLAFVGALNPEVDERQLATIRASACSVDFRWIDDEYQYRLIATCLVNVGGLPSRYAAAADESGFVLTDEMIWAMIDEVGLRSRLASAATVDDAFYALIDSGAARLAAIDPDEIERDDGGRFASHGGGGGSGGDTMTLEAPTLTDAAPMADQQQEPSPAADGGANTTPLDPATEEAHDDTLIDALSLSSGDGPADLATGDQAIADIAVLSPGMLPDGTTADGQPIQFFEVGGAVRDELLGISSKDVDYTVTASSYEMMRDYVTNTLGMKIAQEKPEFVTIKALAGDHPLSERTPTVDFVMSRIDGASSNGRHPDEVSPGTLRDDLDRRDFTMNAIAKDNNGNVIDPHGGRVDLQNGVLRFVGDPEKRLTEDGTRAIRALRFMATKDMTADPATDAALRSSVAVNALMVPSISPERMQGEISKLFNGPGGTTAALDVLSRYPELHPAIFRDGLRLDATMKQKGKQGSADDWDDPDFADDDLVPSDQTDSPSEVPPMSETVTAPAPAATEAPATPGVTIGAVIVDGAPCADCGDQAAADAIAADAAAEAAETPPAKAAAYEVVDIPATDSVTGPSASPLLTFGDQVTWASGIGLYSDTMKDASGADVLVVFPESGGVIDFDGPILVGLAEATQSGKMYQYVDPAALPLDSMVVGADDEAVESPAVEAAEDAPDVEDVVAPIAASADETPAAPAVLASLGHRIIAGRFPTGPAITPTEAKLSAVEQAADAAVKRVEQATDARLASIEDGQTAMVAALTSLTEAMTGMHQKSLAAEMASL